MRTTATVAATLPPALLALLLTGCSAEREHPRDARPVAIATTSSDRPLTPHSAARAFSVWAVNDDLARASGDERLALAWSTDSQRGVTAAEYREAAAKGLPLARHTYGRPTLWVPRVEGYPQWFVASVSRNRTTVLLAFVKSAPEGRFRLSVTAVPDKGVKLPSVVVDADGYATSLSPDDESVLISPVLVAPLQAAVAEDGPKSYSARALKAGPYATGYYSQSVKDAKKAAKDGLKYTSTFTATSQPVFPLRTKDGGCLVLYSLTHDAKFVRKDEGPLKVPGDAAHLVPEPPAGRELHVFSGLRFAAVVPAKSDKKGKDGAKVTVIAEDGAATRIESS